MSEAILDLRSLADEWSEEIDAEDVTRDYSELCGDLGIDVSPDALRSYGDSFEPTLIREDHFVEYAQELAEDIGAINRDLQWPMYCIDWERAARDLRADYMTVRFDGDDYYVRSC